MAGIGTGLRHRIPAPPPTPILTNSGTLCGTGLRQPTPALNDIPAVRRHRARIAWLVLGHVLGLLAPCLSGRPTAYFLFFFNPPGPEGFWGVGVSGTPVDESTGVLSRASPPFFGRNRLHAPLRGHGNPGDRHPPHNTHTHTHPRRRRGWQQRCCVKGWG